MPGTAAYRLRESDSVPDDVQIAREGQKGAEKSHEGSRPSSPATPVPKTIVDKVDPLSPSHGDVPGTAAHSKRQADAVPDVIRPASRSSNNSSQQDLPGATSTNVPVPTTVITKVDSKPSHGEVPGTEAHDIRQGDAKPDIVETKGDVPSE